MRSRAASSDSGWAGATARSSRSAIAWSTCSPSGRSRRSPVFVNHYVSTEIYTLSVRPDAHAKPGSAGWPGIHSALRVVTVSAERRVAPDELVAPGEKGEIIASLASDE